MQRCAMAMRQGEGRVWFLYTMYMVDLTRWIKNLRGDGVKYKDYLKRGLLVGFSLAGACMWGELALSMCGRWASSFFTLLPAMPMA